MPKLSVVNRRGALALMVGAVLAGCSVASAQSNSGGGGFDNPIRAGTYVGKWNDGTRLKEQVVYGEGHIRLTRLSGGTGVGSSSLYAPVGPKLFRNTNGSTITILGKRRFIWRNNNNQNAVKYKLKR